MMLEISLISGTNKSKSSGSPRNWWDRLGSSLPKHIRIHTYTDTHTDTDTDTGSWVTWKKLPWDARDNLQSISCLWIVQCIPGCSFCEFSLMLKWGFGVTAVFESFVLLYEIPHAHSCKLIPIKDKSHCSTKLKFGDILTSICCCFTIEGE